MDGIGLVISFGMLVVGYVGWHLGGKYRRLRFFKIIALLVILAGVAHLILSLGRVALIIVGAVAMVGGGAGIGASFSATPSAPRSIFLIVSLLIAVAGAILCFIAG